jgi:hypothetical protein
MLRPLLTAAFTLACAVKAAAFEPLAEKHGLWETTSTSDNGGKVSTHTFQHCVDGRTPALKKPPGGLNENCSKSDVQKVGDTIVTDSVCKVGPKTITSHDIFTSDGNSYSFKSTIKWEGGPPHSVTPTEGTNIITVEAKWIGECGPEQRPSAGTRADRGNIGLQDIHNLIRGIPKVPEISDPAGTLSTTVQGPPKK